MIRKWPLAGRLVLSESRRDVAWLTVESVHVKYFSLRLRSTMTMEMRMSKVRRQQQPGDMVGEGETLRPCDRLSTNLAGNYVFVSPDAGQVQGPPVRGLGSALSPHWPTVIGLVPSATVRMHGNDVALTHSSLAPFSWLL